MLILEIQSYYLCQSFLSLHVQNQNHAIVAFNAQVSPRMDVIIVTFYSRGKEESKKSICHQLVFGMVYSKTEKPENVFIKFEA